MKKGFDRLRGVAAASAIGLGLLGGGAGSARAVTVTTKTKVGFGTFVSVNTTSSSTVTATPTRWRGIGNLNKELIAPIKTEELNQPAPRPLQSGLVIDKARDELQIDMSNATEGLKKFKDQLIEEMSELVIKKAN